MKQTRSHAYGTKDHIHEANDQASAQPSRLCHRSEPALHRRGDFEQHAWPTKRCYRRHAGAHASSSDDRGTESWARQSCKLSLLTSTSFRSLSLSQRLLLSSGEANPTQPRQYSAWSLPTACRQLASAKGDALLEKAFVG